MIESILGVVAVAGYTAYAIIKDEMACRKAANPTSSKKSAVAETNATNATKSPAKPKTAAKAKPTAKKAAPVEKIAAPEPMADSAKAVLAYLNSKGPASLSKIAQELHMDKATVKSASDQLLASQSAVATKKGGYPGLALK